MRYVCSWFSVEPYLSVFFSGYYAFRRPDTGSWFVKGLCKVFSQPIAEKAKLTSLLTTVTWVISNEYESSSVNVKISGKKQTPCFATMLVKDIYFRPKYKENNAAIGRQSKSTTDTV